MRFLAPILVLAVVLAVGAPADGAATNGWRVFTTADGLAENACVSLTVGASGNAVVRHAKSGAVSVLDGYGVVIVPAPGTNQGRVYESPGGQLWTVAGEGLLEFRDGAWAPHPVPQVARHHREGPTNAIRLQPVRQGRVLILLPGETLQLDASDPDRPRVEAVAFTPPTATLPAAVELPEAFEVRHVHDRQPGPGGVWWFATADGLFRHGPELWQAAPPPRPEETVPNGNRPVTAATQRPPGEWQVHFVARSGDEWFGGRAGIAQRRGSEVRLHLSTNQLGPEDALAFAQSPEGRLWCATPRKVWEFDGRAWLAVRAGFDGIKALRCARDGTLWVAAANGIHRLAQGAWIVNGREDGLPSDDTRQVVETAAGRILVETAAGWCAFHPEADTAPPRTRVLASPPGEARFDEGEVVTLAFAGRDKWKQTEAVRLWFAWRLNELDWSPWQERGEVTFTDLPVGKHYFLVRAMDRAGNVEPGPARLEFLVAVPWYRETRLVLILALALAVSLFFAGLAVNRHRRLRLSYAEVERQVAERTSELELAQRELLHSQKMTALGTLAAGIAHDFNNILSIIKGSAQVIEANPGHPDKIRTRVERIQTVVQQGAGIVEAMLGFSRESGQGHGPCDVNAVVEDTIKLLGDRFQREVRVSMDREADLPAVAAPRDFVQQVVLNLVLNAAEAMPTEKRIRIATRRLTTAPKHLVLTPVQAESYLAISVEDTGCGIPAENLPRIFEPFFTTKAMSTRRGTGLGLSMVYELARKLEAGLAVESVVGQGSTFTLLLPVRAQPVAGSHSHPASTT